MIDRSSFNDFIGVEGKALLILFIGVGVLMCVLMASYKMNQKKIASIGRGGMVVEPALTDQDGNVVKWRVVPARKAQ